MSLYTFSQGHDFLDHLDFPRLNRYENNVIIGRKEFEEEEARGELEWRADGIYLKVDGVYRRGFLYNKDFLVDKWGMPKFHVAKCKTLADFEARGTLHTKYFWSNAPLVTVTQRGGTTEYPDEDLSLCGNCVNVIVDETLNKFSMLSSVFEANEAIVPSDFTDINGRPLNWRRISRRYREKVNFTCEKCSFGEADLTSTLDRRYLHTDHIIADQLTNTADSNLQCLCVLCHMFKDRIHEAKLQNGRIREQLQLFVNSYQHVLSRKNPQLLAKFRAQYSG